MKLRTGIAVLISTVFAGGCFAASKNQAVPKWQQEPTSFMGINLEGNLKYDVNQCPSGYDLPKDLCWKSISNELYEVWGLPKVGIDNLRMSVKVVDARIQYMRLTTYEDQFGKFRDLLIQKYGKPSMIQSEVVKTKVGATFNNDKLSWQGVDINMVLSRYDDNIETSSLTIFSEKAVTKATIENQKQINEAASKL